MVVNNFDLVRIGIRPDEADAPLIVYANAVPTGSTALEGFQTIGGWHPQIIQAFRLIQSDQFSQGCSLNIRRQFLGRNSLPNLFSLLRAERLNHCHML
jgi:hypothetical protein